MPTIFNTHAENGNGIRNRNGTAGSDCHCDSWIHHWKKFTRIAVTPRCSVQGCENLGTDGAHVDLHRLKVPNGKTYIAPMCPKHNRMHGESFRSKPGTKLVWANVQETCGALPKK